MLVYEEFVEFLAQNIPCEQIHIWNNEKLEDIGVDSVTALKLITEIENNYRIKLSLPEYNTVFTPIQLFNILVERERKERNKPEGEYPLFGYAKNIQTIQDLLQYSVKLYGPNKAFTFRNKEIGDCSKTYAEFGNDVLKAETMLCEKFGMGQHIVLFGKNSYQWIVSYFAICNSKNVAVLVDVELPYTDLKRIILQSEGCVILYDGRSEKIRKKTEQFNEELGIPCMDYSVKEQGHGEKLKKQLVKDNQNLMNPEDPVTIIYTSGTTGTNKGVVLSHINFTSDVIAFGRLNLLQGKTVLTLPLDHVFGLTIALMCNIYYGQELYISDGFATVMDEIRYTKPSNLFMVPILTEVLYRAIIEELSKKFSPKIEEFLMKDRKFNKLFQILNRKKLEAIRKSAAEILGDRLTFLLSGGAPFNHQTAKLFELLGIEVLNAYGTSECAPCITCNRVGDCNSSSVGRILSCNTVKIANNQDGGIGEILVKGTNVMLGYYNNQKETEEAFSDGYYKTGDIGKIEDGFLFITGRSKNMILLNNGYNVYPEEIEALIKTLGYVNEVIVYEENQTITAEVYIEDADKRKLIQKDMDSINSNLPNYKSVRNIKLRERCFEKTETGKIKRNL